MSVDYKTGQLYDAAIDEVTKSGRVWKSVCKLTGQLYRYEFDNILMVYMQRPGASLVADFDTWKKVGRYVRRGSRGIAIFPSRALKPEIRYVFDISDTGGRKSRLTWELNKENMKAYAGYLKGQDGSKEAAENESAKDYLKHFTEQKIRVIMDSEFGDRVTEFTHLAGNKRILVDDDTQEITAGEVLKRSIMYAVFTRCGFDIPSEKQDFSFITAFTKEEEIYRLGSLVSDISCEVLKGIARDLTQMERSIAHGRDNNDVSRGNRRDAVSGHHSTGGEGIHDELREVRSEGDGISEGEPQRPLPEPSEVRKTGGEDAGSGGRSIPDDGGDSERLPEKEPAAESAVLNGDVEHPGTGEDAGGGNRHDGSGDEVPLKQETPTETEELNNRKAALDREIEQELKEIGLAGSADIQEGSYEQASFFVAQNGEVSIPEKYTYKKPQQELSVPYDYVRQVLLKGSGFAHGKRRIYAIFQDISDPGERVKAIKREYGQGGAGWPLEGYGLHGYDTFHGKGLRFQWRDEQGEKEGYLNWNAVERELGALIMTGEYYQPPKPFSEEKVSAALWQEPMDEFFRKSFWSEIPNILFHEVFSRDYPLSDKVQFLERVFAPNPYSNGIQNHFENAYGQCNIEQTKEGLSIEFYDAKGTKWKTSLDWWDCASYVEHMIADGVYETKESYAEVERLLAEHSAAYWLKNIKEDADRYLSETPEQHQNARIELLQELFAKSGIADAMEVTWDEAFDEVIASDGETTWHGRQFYDYVYTEVLELNQFEKDERIPFDMLEQFKHDRLTARNAEKTEFIHRKTFDEKELDAEERSKQEEALWLEPLKGYFNEEIQYISVKTLIYDIFTTNLNMESKTEFLASVYGEQREGFFMSEYTDNAYGKCELARDNEGITITYPGADGTRSEKRVDYGYCAALLLHMIEENEYLTEGIFERFREAPEAFTAMPWFMEIYHEYKERMGQENEFAPIEVAGEAEEPEQAKTVQAGETAEPTEHLEGEVIDRDGQIIAPVRSGNTAFPDALHQVETMEEDLREAVELFMQDCTAVKPYQPFLEMVYGSQLSIEDKLYFLNRTINRGEDTESRKSYHNNAYGLIEYTSDKNSLTVDFKNREGERKKTAVTYEQLYSVMEYLIRAEGFTGKTRMAEYTKNFAERGYEKKSSLEKQFEDKLTNLRNNRLKGSFHFESDELPKGGPKTRYQWNVEAVRLLKKIEHEDRAATAEEQKILARYVGWGGIAQAFDERKEDWKKENAELKQLLSKSEYEDARESVTTAYYTSPIIIKTIYQGLEQLGFQRGTILEPSLGVGHFFGAMPEPMQESRLYGVEKDSISGRIAKLLYPKAQIKIRGFEETQYPDNFFDVAVGNIPFGDYKLFDPKYAKYGFRIHDYFLAKAIDKVRPGGIVAFVTSKFMLDKSNSKMRKYVAERAELLGAIRMPDTAFLDSAGTIATSDIVFFQKREHKTVAEPDWVHLGKLESGITVNSYFIEHPEMMLGTMEYDYRRFGNESNYTSCVNHDENFNFQEALKQAVTHIEGKITDAAELMEEGEQSLDMIDADPDVKNYTFTFVNGQLYYRENSKMYRKTNY